ncbi:MAG: hemerythrin domain-containing protein, partial [Mycolicibacterium aromaticivorans]|nr:hemerythrin domain-containing protein [Mycolicibacterium aromaticivorans]
MVETFVQSTTDVVDFLKHQHNLIKDMFDDVLSASESKAREKAFVDLRQLLAVHETAEEMVVHPRARHELTDGDNIVDARLAEEHEAKEQLSALERMDFDSQEFLDELMKFRDAVVEHAEREENEEFSQLQAELDDAAL